MTKAIAVVVLLSLFFGSLFLNGSYAYSGIRVSPPRLIMVEAQRARVSLGCFWSPQRKFTSREIRDRGVQSAVVGYTGGSNRKPTYTTVCAGDGHVEAVDIGYDPSRLSYDDILDEFWESCGSLEEMRAAVGTQYEHVIWAMSEEQRRAAEASIARQLAMGDERAAYVTVRPAGVFYKAEGYHQDYWRKQYPRYALLAGSLAVTVTPNLPPVVYKAAVAGSLVYISTVLLEKVLFNKVEEMDDRVNSSQSRGLS